MILVFFILWISEVDREENKHRVSVKFFETEASSPMVAICGF
jgi:hypothetical protein